MSRIHVLGAGAFGSALADALSRGGRTVRLAGRAAAIRADGPDIEPIDALAVAPGDTVLLAVPAAATAALLDNLPSPLPRDVCLVACAKGISGDRSETQSKIIADRHAGPVAVLTGPSFAEEIARGLPTALTLACADPAAGGLLQERLSTAALRLYLTDDVIGAELGGALKNVVALACGMVEGAGLGDSARAALMTRGFAEMVRLGTAMGARAATFNGLSGLGDLALTCGSVKSRNFSAGIALGRAGGLPQGVTIEGVGTARAVVGLARRHRVEMPIALAVAAVLDGRATIGEAMAGLLARPLKTER